MICSFEGCDNVLTPTNISGYCRTHRQKDENGVFCQIVYIREEKVCEQEDCETILGLRNSSGYCRSHRPRKTNRTCEFEGCAELLGEPNKSGYCESHLRVVEVLEIRFGRAICEYDGCDVGLSFENTTGYCRSHAQLFTKPNLPGSSSQRRRARKRDAFVEDIDHDFVWERDEGICCICNKPADPDKWWLEHIVPLGRGGLHSYDNVGVSHPKCNGSKGDKTMEEYHEWLEARC